MREKYRIHPVRFDGSDRLVHFREEGNHHRKRDVKAEGDSDHKQDESQRDEPKGFFGLIVGQTRTHECPYMVQRQRNGKKHRHQETAFHINEHAVRQRKHIPLDVGGSHGF